MQALAPLALVRPNESLQQALARRRCGIYGSEVDPAPPDDLDRTRQQRGRRPAPVLSGKERLAGSPRTLAVTVGVAVERKQKPRAGTELDEVDPFGPGREQPGQKRPRAAHLVGLNPLLRSEATEELAVPLERAADVVPGGLAAEHEVVQTAEEPQREVPPQVGRDRGNPGVVCEPAAERCVQRRAAVAVLRLAEEDLGLLAQAARADFACSASLPKAAGSLTARSASTLRSSSTFAAFRPAMNWLYESPCARAPALMRMIQRRRNARFLFLRSR